MKRPLLFAFALLLTVPAAGPAFIVTHRVTRDSQLKQGLEFAITSEEKDGVVAFKVVLPRKGKLATLSAVRMVVKDSAGKELMAAPLATVEVPDLNPRNGNVVLAQPANRVEPGVHTAFRLPADFARRCTLIVETEADPKTEFAVNYLVELKGYIGQNEPPVVLPPEDPPLQPEADKPASAPPKDGWAKLKGRVMWDAAIPDQPKIVPGVNKDVCVRDKRPLEEDYIIDPKNKGLKNVFVWILPADLKNGDPFPAKLIHPDLLKPAPTVSIDQPCCRFIPHALGGREGQIMIIKNSAPIAHNAKWSSNKNGDINPLIAAGGEFKLSSPLVAEKGEISLNCSLHSWMKAHVRVFDHPYFTVTDADGNFEINDAPPGNFRVYIQHPATGWLDGKAGRSGKPILIKAGTQNLGTFKMKSPN